MSAMAVESTGSFEPLLHRLEDLERRVLNLEQRPEHHARGSRHAASDPSVLRSRTRCGTPGGGWAGAVRVRTAYFARNTPQCRQPRRSFRQHSEGCPRACRCLSFCAPGLSQGGFPILRGILAGFIYAVSWLIAAGKTDTSDHPTSTVYSLISCIVLVADPAGGSSLSRARRVVIAAILIVVYLCAGQVVAWFNNRREIAAVTVASTTALSLVLFLATYNFVLFAVSLLYVRCI